MEFHLTIYSPSQNLVEMLPFGFEKQTPTLKAPNPKESTVRFV
jgi:hypothetical protein